MHALVFGKAERARQMGLSSLPLQQQKRLTSLRKKGETFRSIRDHLNFVVHKRILNFVVNVKIINFVLYVTILHFVVHMTIVNFVLYMTIFIL